MSPKQLIKMLDENNPNAITEIRRFLHSLDVLPNLGHTYELNCDDIVGFTYPFVEDIMEFNEINELFVYPLVPAFWREEFYYYGEDEGLVKIKTFDANNPEPLNDTQKTDPNAS